MTTWTRQDSIALDVWARSHPNRKPLQPDPRLWELFAPLRETPTPPRPVWDGSPCTECHSPMRRPEIKVADAPGTKPYLGNGVCRPCADKRPKATPLDRCGDCGHTMRRSKKPHPDDPTARRHSANGVCVQCYLKAKYRQTFNQEKATA